MSSTDHWQFLSVLPSISVEKYPHCSISFKCGQISCMSHSQYVNFVPVMDIKPLRLRPSRKVSLSVHWSMRSKWLLIRFLLLSELFAQYTECCSWVDCKWARPGGAIWSDWSDEICFLALRSQDFFREMDWAGAIRCTLPLHLTKLAALKQWF